MSEERIQEWKPEAEARLIRAWIKAHSTRRDLDQARDAYEEAAMELEKASAVGVRPGVYRFDNNTYQLSDDGSVKRVEVTSIDDGEGEEIG